MKILNIAYSCNEAYIQHTGISMLSLFENNKNIDALTIYFIAKDVTESSLLLLKSIADRYHREFIVIPFEQIGKRLKINALGRHIETIYAKLFFAQLEGVDKILYLDSDTIINASLKDLWEIDISNYLVAGVETFTVSAKEKLGLSKKDLFINDGVVVLNLEELRRQKTEDEFVKSIAFFHGDPPVLSEGIINLVCKDKILSLHPKYNLLSGLFEIRKHVFSDIGSYYNEKVIQEAIHSPVIIHYLSALYNRPWDVDCSHPLKDRYLYYKSLSPWKDMPLKEGQLSLRLKIIKSLYKIFPISILNYIRYLKKEIV